MRRIIDKIQISDERMRWMKLWIFGVIPKLIGTRNTILGLGIPWSQLRIDWLDESNCNIKSIS